MDEFLDEMDDEQVDDLLQPEEGEDKAPQLYEHFRFVADRGQSLLRVDKLRAAASVVLSKEPKVESTAIREMREEVKKIIEKK